LRPLDLIKRRRQASCNSHRGHQPVSAGKSHATSAQIEEDTGIRPPFALESFEDVDADVRQSMARIKASPFVPDKSGIRGFVYDVKTGRLREVT
jgi:carbonic anhydrase